jgi:hypothetical protein
MTHLNFIFTKVPHLKVILTKVIHLNFIFTKMPHLKVTLTKVIHLNFIFTKVPHLKVTLTKVIHLNFIFKKVPHLKVTLTKVIHLNFIFTKVPHLKVTLTKVIHLKVNLQFLNNRCCAVISGVGKSHFILHFRKAIQRRSTKLSGSFNFVLQSIVNRAKHLQVFRIICSSSPDGNNVINL